MSKPMHTFYTILIALLVSLAALEASAFSLFNSKIPTSVNYQVLDNEFKNHAPLTKIQSNGLLALESVIRGISKKKIRKKLDIEMSNATFPDSEIFVKQLSVSNVVLTNTPKPDSNIAGIMEFSDDTGRSARFWFNMDLENTAKHDKASVLDLKLIMQANTKVELFIVPADAIDTATVYAVKNYAKFYKNISKLAVNKHNNTLRGEQEYLAIAFYKELLAPNMKVRMKLANNKNGVSGSEDGSRYALIEDSWLVTILPLYSNLALDKKWIKITTQSEANTYDNKLSDEYISGLFSLHM